METGVFTNNDLSDLFEASSTSSNSPRTRKRTFDDEYSPYVESNRSVKIKKGKTDKVIDTEIKPKRSHKRKSRPIGDDSSDQDDFSTQLSLLLDSTSKNEEKEQNKNFGDDFNGFLNNYLETMNTPKDAGDITDGEIDVNNIVIEFKSIKSDVNKSLNIGKSLTKKLANFEDQVSNLTDLVNKQAEIIKSQQNSINEIRKTIRDILVHKNDFDSTKGSSNSRTVYHIIDDNNTVLRDASDLYIREKILEMREEQFGINCRHEIKNSKLKEFLDDEEINSKAISYIKDSGKFCKFIADILLPRQALLKYYFPSKKTRRPTEQLLSDIILKCYNITAKYLGLGIIAEEKTYINYGLHLVNTRTYDKVVRKSNVAFFNIEYKPTFFSVENIKGQVESDTDE